MACIVVAYKFMAYIVIICIAEFDTVMAYTVVPHIVMAYIIMAHLYTHEIEADLRRRERKVPAYWLWHVSYGSLVMAFYLWHFSYGILVMAHMK